MACCICCTPGFVNQIDAIIHPHYERVQKGISHNKQSKLQILHTVHQFWQEPVNFLPDLRPSIDQNKNYNNKIENNNKSRL